MMIRKTWEYDQALKFIDYLKGHWKYPKKVEINWNLDLGGKNKITDVFRFSEIALETT